MKRLFLLFCLVPALLICGCNTAPKAEPATEPTEPDPLLRADLEEYLGGIATEVITAFAYGKFEDVEHYMLYSFDEQLAMLFPGQTAPYEYEGHTFATKEDLADAVRSQLISGEEPDFTITVTKTDIMLYTSETDGYPYIYFDGDLPEYNYIGRNVENFVCPATIVVSFTINNGEESSGTMDVHFVAIGDQWKVYSPTVCGYFRRLYAPATPGSN